MIRKTSHFPGHDATPIIVGHPIFHLGRRPGGEPALAGPAACSGSTKASGASSSGAVHARVQQPGPGIQSGPGFRRACPRSAIHSGAIHSVAIHSVASNSSASHSSARQAGAHNHHDGARADHVGGAYDDYDVGSVHHALGAKTRAMKMIDR